MSEAGSGGRSLDALLGEIAHSPDVVPPESLIGRTLGRYRVDALLGRGGMGVVYRAHDDKLARDVALKVLPPELLGDAERRARFLREARLAASISHPCTAAVYDVGADGETVYIAMELVRGSTLRAVLDATPALDVARAVRITREIARGLAKAHESGILHRDLKPENVMLDEEDHVKILDFGLAKLREVEGDREGSMSTEVGRVLGTPSYMSPEQAKGKAVDPRSDLFSLGIVLYEMLAGERPFRGDSTLEVLIAIDRDPPPPLTRRDAPRALLDVLERCLEKDPARRHGSARELGDALDAVPALATKIRRVPWLAAAAVAVGLGAIGLAARRGPPPERQKAPLGAASLLSPEGAVLACPQLEATGVDAPSGWLGAAAAAYACRRATWWLGGAAKRTRIPAELLDLPHTPREDFPVDPFGEAAARDRQIARAKQIGAVWLDGLVERSAESFRVTLKLRDRAGLELSRGEATAPNLIVAVARATEPLGLPQLPLDRDVAEWSGVRDAELGRALDDWKAAQEMGLVAIPEVLRARSQELGPLWPYVQTLDATFSVKETTGIAAPPLDRSSPASLALTALVRSAIDKALDPGVADELHALYEKQPPSVGRVALAVAEAQIRYRTGNVTPIRDMMTGLVEREPRATQAWDILGVASHGGDMATFARAFAAWVPDAADSWNIQGWSATDPTLRERGLRRAWQLAPDAPLFAANYVNDLVQKRKRGEARAVAARLLQGGPVQKRAGLSAMIGVEASDARFGAALARARTLFDGIEQIGALEDASGYGLGSAVDIAAITGEQPRFSDELVERFVLAEPPRIFRGHYAPYLVLQVCAHARPELAKRCVARLELLIEQGYFRGGVLASSRPWLACYRALLDGDARRAADAARPTLHDGKYPLFVLDAFERVGDVAAVELIENHALERKVYGGASVMHPRAARRAAKRGDGKRARELALAVIDAWSGADVEVGAVREMRELLAKLPKDGSPRAAP